MFFLNRISCFCNAYEGVSDLEIASKEFSFVVHFRVSFWYSGGRHSEYPYPSQEFIARHTFILITQRIIMSCKSIYVPSDFDASLRKTFNNNSVHCTCSRSDYN